MQESIYRYGIVLAGGKGLRMGKSLPKQFIELSGKPILMHTLERLGEHCDELILVLSVEQHAYWSELCTQHAFSLPHQVCDGGATRFGSVQRGLSLVDRPNSLVAIHDGVRPFISSEVIEASFALAERVGSAVPYRPMIESLRELTAEASIAVERSRYVSVQTPQVFRSEEICHAYAVEEAPHFTDDASVYEAYHRKPIALLEGNDENIKITTPKDLVLAQYLISL